MKSQLISNKKIKKINNLLKKFLENSDDLSPFIGLFPRIENFESQIKIKASNYSNQNRQILVKSLNRQYRHLSPDSFTLKQINLISDSESFTVTTGHQLNLMGGPLFFIYKIISVINLAHKLKSKYPKYNFIPVFWMATEDHDFKEINHFNFKGNCLKWPDNLSGPVGRYPTNGLKTTFQEFKSLVEDTPYGNLLKQLFESSYIFSENLGDATRSFVHQLFGKDGLIVLDGDDVELKALFVSHMKDELTQRLCYKTVSKTNISLKEINKNFKIQVKPRDINLFYMNDNFRERIVEKDGVFIILNSQKKFEIDELIEELKNHPDRFSPNVLLRPLYQETILPNLCYVGGDSELLYWMQLKSYFELSKVCYPILIRRNSNLILSSKQIKKLDQLDLCPSDLLLSPDDLTTKIIKKRLGKTIDFSSQKSHLKKQFEFIHKIAQNTDPSFKGAVSAQEKKQINGLIYLEKRLLNAQKRKYKRLTDDILSLQSNLFPEGILQERFFNFSTFFAFYGDEFIDLLKEMNPFENGFYVISL